MCSLWTSWGVLFFPMPPSLFFNILLTFCRCYRLQFIFVPVSGQASPITLDRASAARAIVFFFNFAIECVFSCFVLFVPSRHLRILSTPHHTTPVVFVHSLNSNSPTSLQQILLLVCLIFSGHRRCLLVFHTSRRLSILTVIV